MTDVIDLVVGDLLGGDDADPWAATEPANVGLVTVGFGRGGEVAQVAPEDNDLILHAAAGAAGEELADRQGGAAVAHLVEVFAGHVMDRENLHAVDFIDAVTRGAEGVAAAEPLEEVAHLIGEDVVVAHVFDDGE